uniref:BHLH domain-containing protein n=1 Tax=Acrobeloides nanus TaxID=290746 RepID=A0A914D2J0_9BILA
MHSINRGFDILRQLLPTPYYSKKLSKVDTLKQAIQYINELEFVLKSESNFASNAEKHQANSTAYPMIHQFMVDNATDKNSYVMSISWKRAFDTHSSATNAETFISSNLKTAKVWMPDEHTKN